MKIYVQAKPKAREAKVEQIDETHFNVAVKEPPVGGKANAAIARALSEHLHISISSVTLISGSTRRHKVFNVS